MRTCLALLIAVACSAPPKKIPPVGNDASREVKAPPEPLSVARRELVHFETDKAVILPTEYADLDSILAKLRADPDLMLQISGHTDPTETDADNTTSAGLAHKRATAVLTYLTERGIADRRLMLRGVGSTEPRATNATEAGRLTNRRVQFEKVTVTVSPTGRRTVITDTDIEILDVITFERGKVQFTKSSLPILDAIAATLIGNPSILEVEIQGHTDERGDDLANLRLSQARAQVVKNYLVGKGVDAKRLSAQGYGETQPIDTRHTEAAWAKNTRIAFLILKRN